MTTKAKFNNQSKKRVTIKIEYGKFVDSPLDYKVTLEPGQTAKARSIEDLRDQSRGPTMYVDIIINPKGPDNEKKDAIFQFSDAEEKSNVTSFSSAVGRIAASPFNSSDCGTRDLRSAFDYPEYGCYASKYTRWTGRQLRYGLSIFPNDWDTSPSHMWELTISDLDL